MKIIVTFLIICISLFASQLTDKDYYLSLLQQKNFTTLEHSLQQLYADTQKDITKEKQLLFALNSFRNSDLLVGENIKLWQQQMPNSIYANTAWGMYNLHLGLLSRGARFISKTPQYKIDNMLKYFKYAQKALDKVIKKDKHFTTAYIYLVILYYFSGDTQKADNLMSQALKSNPYSRTLRYNYLNFLNPYWGHSVQDADKFIDESKQLYSFNKELKIIDGYKEYNRVNSQKDHNKSLQLLQKAIQKNSKNTRYLIKLGEHYFYNRHNYTKAKESYLKALKYMPQDTDILIMLSRCEKKEGNLIDALGYINKALQYDGLNPDALRQKGDVLYKLDRKDEAFLEYKKVFKLDPKNVSAYINIGYIFYSKANYKKSSKYLVKASQIGDMNARAWYYLTASYYYMRDCQFIQSAKMYQTVCHKNNTCNTSRLNWIKKSTGYAISHHVCQE